MTDEQFIDYLVENVNRKRREHGLSEVTEEQVRQGLDIIRGIAETFTHTSKGGE